MKKTPAQKNFHELMIELLESMKIKAKPMPSEVYSFSFEGKTQVNIFSPQPDTVDILVIVGRLDNQESSDMLLNLLSMNRYARTEPLMSIGADPATGKITLWTRRSLSGLDIVQLTRLLSRVLDYASVAQAHLQSADGGRKRKQPPKILSSML